MEETNQRAVLLAHCGTRKITREELKQIPAPSETRTHQPLSHYRIVQSLEEALTFRYLKIKREEYAVSTDGMRMFGVMDLEYGFDGCSYSIGMRNSNDKSMRLALTAGLRVFVCDNMAFAGDFTPLLQKHTRNFDLQDLISIGVDRIHRNFDPLKRQVKDWQQNPLSDEEAKLVIYEAFMGGKLKLPRFLLPVVHESYFKPEHEAFKARTLWSLSNAFTSAFKKLKPVQQFTATARLGKYFNEVGENVLSKPEAKSQRNVLMFPAESNRSEEFNGEEELDAFDSQFEREEYESADDYFGDSFDDETDNELMEEFNRKVAA
jgi:hypothetical protein